MVSLLSALSFDGLFMVTVQIDSFTVEIMLLKLICYALGNVTLKVVPLSFTEVNLIVPP